MQRQDDVTRKTRLLLRMLLPAMHRIARRALLFLLLLPLCSALLRSPPVIAGSSASDGTGAGAGAKLTGCGGGAVNPFVASN